LANPDSKAARHVFLAEHAASKIPGLRPDLQARPIRRVAVVGAGTMGAGIAMNFLSVGFPVTLIDAEQGALDRAVHRIRSAYRTSVEKGRMSSQSAEHAVVLLEPTLDYAGAAAADLFIEAVFEDLAVKERVWRQIDKVAKPGAILATNTSTLDVDRIAGFTGRPRDLIGMHFFSPAQVMKLLEIVRGGATAD
jgi:3-hydroxyacyl-CoA dehydrogenase